MYNKYRKSIQDIAKYQIDFLSGRKWPGVPIGKGTRPRLKRGDEGRDAGEREWSEATADWGNDRDNPAHATMQTTLTGGCGAENYG